MTSLGQSFLGALLIAALSTLGDFVWAQWIPAHRAVFGLAHGTLLCLGIGLYLGALRRRLGAGALGGAAIGFGAAAGYYLLAPFVGYAAMFVLWMALWAAFALLVGRGLGGRAASDATLLVRGALAAIGSGLAFYAVSGIWTRPKPGGPNYAYNFLCWTLAFLPGFLPLLAGKSLGTPDLEPDSAEDSPGPAGATGQPPSR